jgi:hypothetical protein
MNYWRAVFAGLTLTVVGFGTFSCSSEGDEGTDKPGSGLPEVTAIMGQALDTSGGGVASVTVRGGGAQTTTAADGTFQLDAPAGQRTVVTFEKPGYLRGIKRVDVQDGTPTALRVTLLAEALPVEMDADTGGAVDGSRRAGIVAPAAAFVDPGGAPISGTVQVHLTPLDPAISAELAAYPGDLAARQTDGTIGQLETYGVLDVTIRQDGKELQIGDGKSIDIRIPAPSAGVSSPPATVELWSFDNDEGIWIEEGVATYNADDHTYDATISHLSPWNADVIQESTCVRGRVTDQHGNAIPGSHLEASGVSYLGWSSATAGQNGEFCIVVQKNSTVEILAIHPLGGGTLRTVNGGSSDSTVPPNCATCSDVGTWVVEKGSVTGPGGTVDCADIDVPFVGTCAEGMLSIFTCFNPQGACTYNMGTGTIRYENGATMTASAAGGTFVGPGGVACGSYVVDYSNTTEPKIVYTNNSGESWVVIISESGDQTIECPNGETVVMTSAQSAAMQACGGGGGSDVTEECTIEGGTGLPTACTKQEDCPPGEVCCENYGFCLPDYPGICDE